MAIPLRGDRAAHDSKNYPRLHASDLDAGTPIQHLPTVEEGQLPKWDGDKWIGVNLTSSTITPQILRYDAETKAYLYYGLDTAGLVAALAAASPDDAVILPPCNIVGDFTVPVGVTLIGQGPGASQIIGTVTLSTESDLHSLWVQKNNVSPDEAMAVIGPETGGAQIRDSRIGCLCSDIAGDATGIATDGGWIAMRNTYVRVTAQNASAQANIFKSAGIGTSEAHTCIFANTGSLAETPSANWNLYSGNQPFLSSCTWHAGYIVPNISYRPGDRAPLVHTHAESDIINIDHNATKLQGRNIANAAPSDGQGLVWDNAVGVWRPGTVSGGGSGDMAKSVYDTDGDGIVDAAESVPWSGVSGKPSTFTPSSHTHTETDITNLDHDADKIKGRDIDAVAPANGQAILWDSATSKWKPGTVSGSGDMLKSVYDADNDGIVDEADHASTADHATTADYAIQGAQHALVADSADGLGGFPVSVDNLNVFSDYGLALTFNPDSLTFSAKPTPGIKVSGTPAEGQIIKYISNVWTPIDNKQQIVFTVDGNVAVSAGKFDIGNYTGSTKTLHGIYLRCKTAPAGADIIVNIKKDGAGITTSGNRPVITAGSTTGNSTTLSTTSWANGEVISMDVDQVGSSTTGSDLVVVVVYS